MNSGIYKWISPTGRVYVGQSKNLTQRKEWYNSKAIYNSSMTKLKRSFEKHGIENHKFEIIEYCNLTQLNEREIYWGLFYNTLTEGLNCKLGEQNCIFSEDTINKMSNAKKGKPLNKEHQVNKEISLQRYWNECEFKKEVKKSQKQKYIPTQKHKDNLSKVKKGKSIHTNESREILRKVGKKRDMIKCYKAGIEARSIPIHQYDLQGNFIKEWINAIEAELFYNKKGGDNIRACVRGKQKTAYGYVWKNK
jgi:group I intron endonuclease